MRQLLQSKRSVNSLLKCNKRLAFLIFGELLLFPNVLVAGGTYYEFLLEDIEYKNSIVTTEIHLTLKPIEGPILSNSEQKCQAISILLHRNHLWDLAKSVFDNVSSVEAGNFRFVAGKIEEFENKTLSIGFMGAAGGVVEVAPCKYVGTRVVPRSWGGDIGPTAFDIVGQL